MDQNLYQIQSTEQFQDLLSADLNRVSLLYFWAPWANPCSQMTTVVHELSEKYPAALFLQVEAEEQSEIAESFDIEAVPTFVLLRGHILLGRVSGADTETLTGLLAKHVISPSYNPLSHTDQKPAPPTTMSNGFTEQSTESPEKLEERLRVLMKQSQVVLFMKGSPDAPRCGFSRKIVNLLKDQRVDFTHFDILTDENVRQGLKKLNDWPTYPQLIVNGELVGGLDIVQEMADSGELLKALA